MVDILFSLRSAGVYGLTLGLMVLGINEFHPLTPRGKDLEALRQAVAGFHDLSAAQASGYTTAVGDPTDGHTCLSNSAGGMGVHYLKKTLVDDTVIVTQPEIMIYEPQKDGSMKFVGVEYIIPYSIRGADQPPPVLFGQAFMKIDHFQLWGLHAWVGRENSSGTFAMWNPDVSCQFAHS
ncbi:MAG TPA: hypothetical protein VK617_08725 [Gemmatimonadaceae bacterium]|nr:hypothetical protein [Gemmatimonadaceae bacterium]